MLLSIIIPVFNESKTLKEIIRKVEKVDVSKEIIAVNDGSSDDSRVILEELEHEGRIKLINHGKNLGKGAAIKSGLKKISGDLVIIQDADLEYNPDDYLKLLEPLIKKEADIVFGSRNMGTNNVPINRYYFYGGLLSSKIFNFLFNTNFTDIHTCYKIFPAKLAQTLINLPGNDFVFDAVELTHALIKSGKVIEIPINYTARSVKAGKKLNWRHGFAIFGAMFRLRFNLN